MMTYTLMRQQGFTPADCVRIAAELKMDGIDWVTTYGEDPALLRKMSEDAGLAIAAYTFFINPKEGEDVAGLAEKGMDIACDILVNIVKLYSKHNIGK